MTSTGKRSLGIDIGSTTAKLVLTEDGTVTASLYERHFSRVRECAERMLRSFAPVLGDAPFTAAVSGSAGLGLAEAVGLPFVQEVYATGEAVRRLAPDTGVVIELGGEDAKVIFFAGGLEERMNGACAGGTGAFIDQMAALLNMTPDEMDAESLRAERLYPIASRCGVFAKTDIQPLLNQGASRADVAASIYQAVVNQTIVGLIRGRRIDGKVMFLGGPLHYCRGLRIRFCETLGLTDETAVFPDYGRYAVALGAAMYAEGEAPTSFTRLAEQLAAAGRVTAGFDRLPPLFACDAEYAEFRARHGAASVPRLDLASYAGGAWLGVDCGSTTTKLALVADGGALLYSYYHSNEGEPVSLVLAQLREIRRLCADRVTIRGCAATGYGEELMRHAFHTDFGVVETVAHYTAARHFEPDVDFILDIGGQDIKCFRVRNGAIDGILLNEACSSGCGSFIEAFARSMGFGAAEFARLGLTAEAPVSLGSRCTVFMNSSVKQAQKDGASVADISAGLSVSVVKNALYKVIRAISPKELGEHIVVQGGTFHNDAVLRAFEKELHANVVRPAIAGLMGAYGAALYAQARMTADAASTLLSAKELAGFAHTASPAVCGGCENHCRLTVNRFADGGRFVSGNRCERGAGGRPDPDLPNLHAWKRTYIEGLRPVPGRRGAVGLPLELSMYELAPLWHALFTHLGFEARLTRPSTRSTYERGQMTIPSDTVCYPAKLMHGHIEELLDGGADAIFYPSLTYNVEEHAGDNHFNCPVVAYYAEVLADNVDRLRGARFLYPYVSVDSPAALAKTLYPSLRDLDPTITQAETRRAAEAGFAAYRAYTAALQAEGERALSWARAHGRRVMILAGRPYHADPEVGHGIDELAGALGFVVVSEDSVCRLAPVQRVRVLDQWTFHARLYRAARYAAEHDDVQLVQLVSFGCGVDAITGDEVRAILEGAGKHYTQIKIDEITNLGAVRVRLRSLIGALEAEGK